MILSIYTVFTIMHCNELSKSRNTLQRVPLIHSPASHNEVRLMNTLKSATSFISRLLAVEVSLRNYYNCCVATRMDVKYSNSDTIFIGSV